MVKNSYTDDELAGAHACVEFEQYVLMTCSVPLLKFASTVPVNYTIEQTTFVVSFYIVKTMAYTMLATKDHFLYKYQFLWPTFSPLFGHV